LHHSTHQQLTTVTSAPERIKIDKQGRIVNDQRRGNAPFPIGNLSRLAIEPLSAMDEKGWTVDSERRIVLRPMTDDLPSLRDYGEEGALLAREKSRYTIKGTEGKKLLIRKTYEFATIAEENGQVRLTVSGEGDLTFDQEAEVFGSSTMTTEVRLRDGADLLQEATKVQSGLIRVTQEPSTDQPEPGKARMQRTSQGSSR
jgi:hypothetical protein